MKKSKNKFVPRLPTAAEQLRALQKERPMVLRHWRHRPYVADFKDGGEADGQKNSKQIQEE